jgi:undecaprenyl-diphosphatase
MLIWLEDAERVDLELRAAIAATHSPSLERWISRLSDAAHHSRLSLPAAATIAIAGDPAGRGAALVGTASIAATSTVVNLVLRPLARCRWPDKIARDVPITCHLKVPTGRSGQVAAAHVRLVGEDVVA